MSILQGAVVALTAHQGRGAGDGRATTTLLRVSRMPVAQDLVSIRIHLVGGRGLQGDAGSHGRPGVTALSGKRGAVPSWCDWRFSAQDALSDPISSSSAQILHARAG